MDQEKLTEIIEKYNPKLKIEDTGDSYILKQGLSEYIGLIMEIPYRYGGRTQVNLSALIGNPTPLEITRLTPEEIIRTMKELILYRDKLEKRGYSSVKLIGSDETTDTIEYVYKFLIEPDVPKLIKDFNLLEK